MRKTLRVTAALALAATALVYAATESGVVLKADSIKSEPFKDASTVGNLSKGEAVQIVTKNRVTELFQMQPQLV